MTPRTFHAGSSFLFVLTLILWLWASPLQARPFEPPTKSAEVLASADPEFQVNTYTLDAQTAPDVARHGGGFVVVWASYGSPGDDADEESIQARRYDADGAAIGAQFQVNDVTTGRQFYPVVATSADGGFAVVWSSVTGGSLLKGKIFDSAGTPLAPEFQISSATVFAGRSDVAASADGFVVAFAPYPGDGGFSSIRARRYDSAGTALGLSFQVNSYTPLTQRAPRIRAAPDSTFVVVWESSGSAGTDTADKSVQMRRLASDGTPLGEDFQVNSYSTGDASFVQAAFGDDGGFVVAWGNDGGSPDGDNDGAVVARRFDSSGAPVGSDFQVNETYVDGYQVPSGLVATPEGGFLVAWAGDAAASDDTSNWAVAGLRLDGGAGPVGSEFVINTLTTGYQTYARLAVDAEGDYLVVWDSEVSAGDDVTESIQGRYFAVQIFADGFESGDTTAWSATLD